MALVTAFVAIAAIGTCPRATHAAEAKPAWQVEWEKVLAAAKKEGQVAVYISGYEEVLPDFQKEYPEIKVAAVTGRGSQVGQRLLAERRGEKYLADVVSAGGVTTYQQLFPAKVFDPIKPALLLPEITDPSKWYEGRHHYADPENQYIFSYVATATYGSISYNTKLVDAKDFKSYWDLLNPKWKGKIISRDVRVPGPGSGNARLFYYLPDLGPSFIQQIVRRNGHDSCFAIIGRVRIGSPSESAICFFCDVDVLSNRDCPVETFGPRVFKEGAGLVQQFGTLALVNKAPHPNAAKVFINWLLSRKGQIALQKTWSIPRVPPDSLRIDIPKDDVPVSTGGFDGVKYYGHEPAGWQDMKPILQIHERGAEGGGEELKSCSWPRARDE